MRSSGSGIVKRGVDVVGSSLGLVLLSPLLLLAAVLVKVTSSGPVLFAHDRIGLDGRRFRMYKLRTMREGAEAMLAANPELQEWDGPVFRVRGDARVTPVGRVLRKYAIDELPQLFNVLRGDMSLVGPRPHLPEEVARYEPWHRERLSCRPGLTCLWQAGLSGDSDRHHVPTDEWIESDLEYLREQSLWLDVRILLHTAWVVLSGRAGED